MKIGFFTDTYLPTINGVSTSIDGMARSLMARGHEVTIIAPKSPGYRDKRKNIIRLRSIKVVKEPEIRLAAFVPERTLVKVTQKDFDIIHGFAGGTITSLGLGLSKVKGIPFIGSYNTRLNQYTHYFLKGKIIRPKIVEQATRLFANRCDCLVVPANPIKEELQSFGVTKPIVVLPNGVDTALYSVQTEGFLKKKLAIPKGKKILLSIGRLGKEKSIDFLIKSMPIILRDHPDAVLVIVGDGPEKKKLMALSKRKGIEKNVYFSGFIDPKDIPKVYQDATLFVFASQTETQGMVILESLAAGVPVVAVQDGVYEEMIEDNVNGLLTNNDTSLFAHAVSSLLSHPQKLAKMKEEAYKSAKKHSLENIAKAFENIYQKMIEEKEKTERITLEKLFTDYFL